LMLSANVMPSKSFTQAAVGTSIFIDITVHRECTWTTKFPDTFSIQELTCVCLTFVEWIIIPCDIQDLQCECCKNKTAKNTNHSWHKFKSIPLYQCDCCVPMRSLKGCQSCFLWCLLLCILLAPAHPQLLDIYRSIKQDPILCPRANWWHIDLIPEVVTKVSMTAIII
jgi:hypothetical protein